MPNARARWQPPLLVAVFCVFFFFYGLGAFGLLGADEPRYAQVAREMLARHDWLTPTLFGHAWLEKPPLLYWGAMVSYSIFGVRDWAARVPSAILAALMVFAIFLFARRFRQGMEVTAALMTASAVAIFAFARGASTDMPLAATFAIAMLAWFCWLVSGARKWLALFYFWMALAALAKGPVAPALAALVIIIYALVRREPGLIARTLWLWGIALFCIVTLPWYVLVQLRNPQFFGEFILRQNFARFSTDLYRHHYAWWYYTPVLLLGLFPWTVFSIAGFVQAVRVAAGRLRASRTAAETTTARPAATPEQEREALGMFLLVWAVVPLIFFSISRSKLPGYILPAIPAWILLAALYLRRRSELPRPMPSWLMVLHSLWLGVIIGAVALAPPLLRHDVQVPASALRIAAAVAVAVFVFSWILLRVAGEELARFATLLPLILAVGFVLKVAAPQIDASLSGRPVAARLAPYPRNTGTVTFDVHRAVQFGIAFYRNQPVLTLQENKETSRPFLLIAPLAKAGEIEADMPAVQVGGYPPQRLGFWWVVPER